MNVRTALFMQSIRGPVVLITVGALFAIHQAGISVLDAPGLCCSSSSAS